MKAVRALSAPPETTGTLLDHMATLADPLRCRIVFVLEQHELTVGELCAVLQLPQSTVSRHLKTLADGGWVVSRPEGTSRYYGPGLDGLDDGARRLWPLLREQLAGTPAADQDGRRLSGILARRRSKSEAFFASASGQWDHLRTELFGGTFHLHALLALLGSDLVVGDLGCGTGPLAELLAPHVAQVVGVDSSAEMLQTARHRLAGLDNVDLRRGDLQALPIDAQRLDAALLVLVLHHLPDPARAVAEAGRVLKPGGRLLIADMFPHDRAEYQGQMGHVWLGFSERTVEKWLEVAGLERLALRALPVDPDAKGPALFVATARKPTPAVPMPE
jgi:SAM-dependent methyltransferase